MPVIDPSRLAQQVAKLQAVAADPAELTQAVAKLLDEYLDRTHRLPLEDSTVPAPVHRAVLHALVGALEDDDEAVARAAAALWRATPIAAKSLAASLIGSYPGSAAADLAEAWAAEAVPPRVIQLLGEVGLTSWRRMHPSEFLLRAEGWLADRRRLLAFYGLRAAVLEPEFEDLPAIFQLLDGIGGRVRGESKRAFGLLIKALASRSANETVQFLVEQAAAGTPGTAWMRALLSDRSFRSPR
jgi:hypothetical protein